jgi:anti-sigma factor RsiW
MTHLGHRLSALIDDELDLDGRDRVLVHLAKCEDCRREAVALRTLKRRMNALGGEAEADSALTGRLMGLAALSGGLDGHPGMPLSAWSAVAPAAGRGLTEPRSAWYVLGGAFTVFLAGIGTAAFMAGGSPQVQDPEPKVIPSVDVLMVQHEMAGTDGVPAATPTPSISSGFGRKSSFHGP